MRIHWDSGVGFSRNFVVDNQIDGTGNSKLHVNWGLMGICRRDFRFRFAVRLLVASRE